MVCYACDRFLSDSELQINSDEDFINNKCLCRTCLSVSNEWVRNLREDSSNNEDK